MHMKILLRRVKESRWLSSSIIIIVLLVGFIAKVHSFTPPAKTRITTTATPSSFLWAAENSATSTDVVSTVEQATQILQEWDRKQANSLVAEQAENREELQSSVRLLNRMAAQERNDSSLLSGRCMLGICASNATEGLSTLKAWVGALDLPRGLLHGMDVDGVPVEMNGGVYIKYNSGGVCSFADIRKSQRGFDALWKPGDAMVEEYDGTYRGVYFQVELEDEIFRQFLVPLDLF